MQSLASKAYGQVTQRTASERGLELALFEQVTHGLELSHSNNGINPGQWGDAIHRNMQLWSLIAVDLLSPANALPNDTKRSLLSLSEFVRRTSLQILSGHKGIADLIEINRTIMAGLGQGQRVMQGGEV